MTEGSIDIALPATTAFCEVSWRQWAVDSRDGETDRVLIDGEEVCSGYSRPFPPPALSPLFSLCLLSPPRRCPPPVEPLPTTGREMSRAFNDQCP